MRHGTASHHSATASSVHIHLSFPRMQVEELPDNQHPAEKPGLYHPSMNNNSTGEGRRKKEEKEKKDPPLSLSLRLILLHQIAHTQSTSNPHLHHLLLLLLRPQFTHLLALIGIFAFFLRP